MSLKRLVLFVEGEGDVDAVVFLVKKLLASRNAFSEILLDENPFRVGEFGNVQKQNFGNWKDKLKAALKRKNVGGCLLLLDGDSKVKIDGQNFCCRNAAMKLAESAREIGAGTTFSVASVFALMEFESWFFPAVPQLVGKKFEDGRSTLKASHEAIPENPEMAPRDAKGWFRKNLVGGYNEVRDQCEIAKLIDWNSPELNQSRSFRRLINAVTQLVAAIRTNSHIVSPEAGR